MPFGVAKWCLVAAIAVALVAAVWGLGTWLGTKPKPRNSLPGAQTWSDR
jgi:hypothetical protein